MDALTETDIEDLRAWERRRDEERPRISSLRKRRRVALGDVLTGAFENRDTIRWQIQEMLRIEKSLDEDAVTNELRAYNPLLPGDGELSLTIFVDVTEPGAVREWLHRLVGIENHVALVLPDETILRAVPEDGHRRSLTRGDVTSAVHYLRIPVPAGVRVPRRTRLVVDHPGHRVETELADETIDEINADLGS